MAKEIKFSLLYRDMWQSSGKYVPTVDQLLEVAPAIIDMGCFARVETNGGGFEQINLLFGENPNVAVRKWTQPFNDAGIQTHMLERGLNGIRMSPVPADVRRLMFHVKKKQGTDIARSFDGLNDPRNLEGCPKSWGRSYRTAGKRRADRPGLGPVGRLSEDPAAAVRHPFEAQHALQSAPW
jgi:pyruvate carboxylase subunit B